MVFVRENATKNIKKWMMTGGSPISGNPYVLFMMPGCLSWRIMIKTMVHLVKFQMMFGVVHVTRSN